MFVHLGGDDEPAAQFFGKFGLEDVSRIGDPEGSLYRAFGLDRARFGQILNGTVAIRGLQSIFKGFLPGVPKGDTLRMPGAFLIQDGKVSKSYFHKHIADRPDLLELSRDDPDVCKT